MSPRAARRLAIAQLALAVPLALPGPVLQVVVGYEDPADIPFTIGFVAGVLCPACAGATLQPGHVSLWLRPQEGRR
jgi:hypothetical protein